MPEEGEDEAPPNRTDDVLCKGLRRVSTNLLFIRSFHMRSSRLEVLKIQIATMTAAASTTTTTPTVTSIAAAAVSLIC